MILSNSFKGLLLGKIMNPPKWWFHSIDEVIKAPSDYQIYVPPNKITYFTIEKWSNYDPKFKQLLNRITKKPFEEIWSNEVIKKFWERKCARLLTSYNLELAKLIHGNEMVVDEVQYDHVLGLRLIRKDLSLKSLLKFVMLNAMNNFLLNF